MLKYRIIGADRDTAGHVEQIVYGSSLEEVERHASDRGILISKIERLYESSLSEADLAKAKQLALTTVIFIMLIVLVIGSVLGMAKCARDNRDNYAPRERTLTEQINEQDRNFREMSIEEKSRLHDRMRGR